MMAAQKESPAPDPSPKHHRPIELVTENGFCILRLWEINGESPPDAGKYHFVVRNPHGLERVREIVVAVADDAAAQIEEYTRGRIPLRNSFWIYCAERHLANYVWQHDDYPPSGRLRIDQLTPEDFELAMRWETT